MVVEILYVPTVVSVAVMVCVTPDTETPVVIVPAGAVIQVKPETTAVSLAEGLQCNATDRRAASSIKEGGHLRATTIYKQDVSINVWKGA